MRTGLDRLKRGMLPGRRIGLLSHYAAVNSGYRSSLDVLTATPEIEIQMLFGPQHGWSGETQDNMIEWEGYIHPQYGIPVYSLYDSMINRIGLDDMMETTEGFYITMQVLRAEVMGGFSLTKNKLHFTEVTISMLNDIAKYGLLFDDADNA